MRMTRGEQFRAQLAANGGYRMTAGQKAQAQQPKSEVYGFRILFGNLKVQDRFRLEYTPPGEFFIKVSERTAIHSSGARWGFSYFSVTYQIEE